MGHNITRQFDQARLTAHFLRINTVRGIESAERVRRDAPSELQRNAARDLIDRLERSLAVLDAHPELLSEPGHVGPLPRLDPLEELALTKLTDAADEDLDGTHQQPGGSREVYLAQETLGALMGGRDRTHAGKVMAKLEARGLLERTGEYQGDVPRFRIADVVPAWHQRLTGAGVLLVNRHGGLVDPSEPTPRRGSRGHLAWDTKGGRLVEFLSNRAYNEYADVRANVGRRSGSWAREEEATEFIDQALHDGLARVVEASGIWASEKANIKGYLVDRNDREARDILRMSAGDHVDKLLASMASRGRAVPLNDQTEWEAFGSLHNDYRARREALRQDAASEPASSDDRDAAASDESTSHTPGPGEPPLAAPAAEPEAFTPHADEPPAEEVEWGGWDDEPPAVELPLGDVVDAELVEDPAPDAYEDAPQRLTAAPIDGGTVLLTPAQVVRYRVEVSQGTGDAYLRKARSAQVAAVGV